MVEPIWTPLEELQDDLTFKAKALPGERKEDWTPFAIPQLGSTPHNAILDAIGKNNERLKDKWGAFKKRTEVGYEGLDAPYCVPPLTPPQPTEDERDVWLDAVGKTVEYKNHIVSWDTLRFSHDELRCLQRSPFLTEQHPRLISAAKSMQLKDSTTDLKTEIHLRSRDLMEALAQTVVGCSSSLFEWDAASETFVPARTDDAELCFVLDGVDGDTSNSFIARITEIGSLVRRLDDLAESLTTTTKSSNSTVIAFAHALVCALAWVRHELQTVFEGDPSRVSYISTAVERPAEVLRALALLCFRGYRTSPSDYPNLPTKPTSLLSHVYESALSSEEKCAPKLVRAMLSHILTITSRPYLRSLSLTVGLERLEETLEDARRRHSKLANGGVSQELHPDEMMDLEDSEDLLQRMDVPTFVPKSIREDILACQRSIRILASPELENGEPVDVPDVKKLEWIWTDAEVTAHALGYDVHTKSTTIPSSCTKTPEAIDPLEATRYKLELSSFSKFDIEPTGSFSQRQQVHDFISSFPEHLPTLTPTISLLAAHVLSPISKQAVALGRATLRRFLTPGTHLYFRAHFVLLRAYLLLSAPAFKARLSAALFSDAEMDEDEDPGAAENPMGMTIRTRGRNANWKAVRTKELGALRKGQTWAVGLAFGLTDRAQWPPGGSDLSFYLRRVIMDSLEDVRDAESGLETNDRRDHIGDDEFWDGAETRLGFAIRDLPVGGREKWLDPTLMEALDFLYMDYRPHQPLRSLITPDIMSKYHRVFAFLLRLLRVEAAMRVVFRLTRPKSIHVFETLPETQRLVLHFRFMAQTFVAVLSGYIADTAVRGNVDAFAIRLQAAETAIHFDSSPDADIDSAPFVQRNLTLFADVYALMQRHSRTLDAVLAACLLRGAQHALRDIIRSLLETILEFSNLVGNAHRAMIDPITGKKFDEPGAALRVEALFAKFKKTREVLMMALRKATERASKAFATEDSKKTADGLPAAPGGAEALSDLLLRLGGTGTPEGLTRAPY